MLDCSLRLGELHAGHGHPRVVNRSGAVRAIVCAIVFLAAARILAQQRRRRQRRDGRLFQLLAGSYVRELAK